jgi:hypothetical protein
MRGPTALTTGLLFSQLGTRQVASEAHMQPHEKLSELDAQVLSEELSRLTRLQYEALQKSSYINMPKQEADAYDERRCRSLVSATC